MPARVRLALAVAGVLVLAGLAGLLAFRGGERAAEGGVFAGFVRPAGIAPAELTGLRDQDGRPASLRSLRGKVVVVTFLYTTCRDTCPLTADQVRGALDDLDRDVPALAVSVDPPRDTADRARRFLLQRRLSGRMRFLVGARADLARQWRAYGIQPQGEDFEHSASVVLLDRRGRQRVGFPVSQLTPEALAHDIRVLQAEPA